MCKKTLLFINVLLLTLSLPTYATPKENIKKAKITLNQSIVYTGTARKPSVSVKLNGKKLKAKKDYSITYKNNINAGIATLIIKGKGKYFGTARKNFKITPVNIKYVSANTKERTYTGHTQTLKGIAVRAVVNKKLKNLNNKDYKVTYKNNINVGTATVSITGKGNYKGTINKTFKILPVSLSDVIVNDSFEYTGKEIKPLISVYAKKKLLTEKDYRVYYQNNINTGTATITVVGCRNYSGSITRKFHIVKKEELTTIQNQIISEIEKVISEGQLKMVSVHGASQKDYQTAMLTILTKDEYGYVPTYMPCGDEKWRNGHVENLSSSDGFFVIGNDLKYAKECSGINLSHAKDWCESANISSTDKDITKIQKINRYIADQINYDKSVSDARNAWDSKKGKCSAYAEVAYCMYKVSGIPARIVEGTDGNEAHSWNMVYINDEWIHTDACFMDSNQKGIYNNSYLISPNGWNRQIKKIYG